jgi:hypothetical protein
MKLVIKALKGKMMFELRDLLKVISECIHFSHIKFILYEYEFNGINESKKVNNEIIEYLSNRGKEGIQITFEDLSNFSEYIYQSIDGKLEIISSKIKVEIEIIDSYVWEISYECENYLIDCLKMDKKVQEFLCVE